MNIPNNTITLTITHLGGLGDGVGEYQGKPVFVPYAAPGDVVSVVIEKSGKEFSRGRIVEVLTPSPDRQEAPCAHFAVCGGCSLQHVSAHAYQAFKQSMLAQAIKRAGGDEAVIAPLITIPPASRRRAVFKVQQGKLGYYQPESHKLVAIEHCPVLDDAISQKLPEFRALLKTISYETLAVTASDSGLDVVLSLTKAPGLQELEYLSRYAKEQDIARIAWQRGEELTPIIERCPVQMQTGDVAVSLPLGTFMQATKQGQQAITAQVLAHLPVKAKQVIDLYAGCGTYSFAMHEKAKVFAVEGSQAMADTINRTAIQHQLQGRVSGIARDLVKQPVLPKELDRYDAIVINPPRNGAKAQAEQIAKSKVPVVIMVSCNPISFATDAKILLQAGYKLTHAVGIDQFVWSGHLELVAVFGR